MATPPLHEHDLEDHIPLLRKLDEARKRSGTLRNEGIEVLIAHHQDLLRSHMFDSALALRALGTMRNQPFEDKEKQEKLLATVFELGADLQKLTLQHIADDDLSALAAARILRALAVCPGAAFSKTALRCYYWIARELYTAEASDWNTGGIRAASGGAASAFVTGECVHALLSFAEAHEKTGEFIDEVGKFKERTEQLKQLEADCPAIAGWVTIEKDRLRLSFSLTLQRLSRYLVLPIVELPAEPAETITNEFSMLSDFAKRYIAFSTSNKNSGKANDKFAEEFLKRHLKPSINTLIDDLDNIRGEINDYRRAEENQSKYDLTKSKSAHYIALSAVETALERVKDVKKVLESDAQGDNKKLFGKLKQHLNDAAKEVGDLLRPAMNYLDTVFDRELLPVSCGEQWDWQPAELTFAATAYGRLRYPSGKWEKDPRFERAARYLSEAISRRGVIPNKRPYHIEDHANLHYHCSNSAALMALAHLLRFLTKPEIEPDLIEKILEFFDETRAAHPYKDWRFTREEIRKSNKSKEMEAFPILTGEFQKYLRLKGINEKRRVIDGLQEVLATWLNQILEDLKNDALYNSYQSSNIKNNTDINKVIKTLYEEKGRDNLVRANRLILEDIYPNFSLKSSAVNFESDKKEVVGWSREYSIVPRETNLTATAHAVFALAEINKMLDTRINHIILEHFSVKSKDKELSTSTTLDSLFYPDYGLTLAPESIEYSEEIKKVLGEEERPKEIRRKEGDSVAITLQRMRAHLSRVSLPNRESLCSLVLHGPAGTGKTTLVEALAVTCDMPLVEVTPSDLVKRGEEDIERRAQAVFKALSMLTRVVILFDEFDPVLKRRDTGNNKPLSVFSFLTPGMLPKLKDLHTQAEKRSVAYVLVTNLIGDLDEAAVRQGRFDERLGIYPPDLLSRTGRFLDQITTHNKWKWKMLASEKLPSGIEILNAPGLANGQGNLLITKETDNELILTLTWPSDETGSSSFRVEIVDKGRYELTVMNKNGSEGYLFINISEEPKLINLSQNISIKITISETDNLPWNRIVEIIRETQGRGMTALGKRGWFTSPKDEAKPKTLFYYVREGGYEPDYSESDDELKGIRGKGRTAITEWLQWFWGDVWDKKLSNNSKDELFKVLTELKNKPGSNFLDENKEEIKKKLNMSKFTPTHWEVFEVLKDGGINKLKWYMQRSKHDLDEKKASGDGE